MTEGAWTDLLNSDWHDHLGSGRREDRLSDPDWRGRFFAAHALDVAGIPDDRLIPALRALRELMRRIADAYAAGGAPPRSDWEALNACFARAPLARRIAPPVRGARPRLGLAPLAGRLDSLLGDIAQTFVATLAEGDPARVKVCRNADCHWIFYDRSKNRTRKWCEATCGNLMKVRRFRERNRERRY